MQRAPGTLGSGARLLSGHPSFLIRRDCCAIIRGAVPSGMNVLIINQSEVRRLLPMDECMTAMAGALSALTKGEAVVLLRMITWLPERVGALGLMPSYHTGINAMGVKVVSVFPKNHGTEFDSH